VHKAWVVRRHLGILISLALLLPAGLQAETDRPSIDFGNVLRVSLEAKLQADLRHFSPALPQIDENQLEKARLGLKGRFLEHFYYEIERDFRRTLGADRPLFPWTDVNVEARGYRPFDVKIGKFKLPLGMEQNTSTTKLDFVYRSRISQSLAPGRDKGVLITGRWLEGLRLKYEAGVFQNDGENSHEKDSTRKTGGRTFSARVEGEPIRALKLPFRTLQLGMAVVSSNVPERSTLTTNSIRGETVAGETFFHRMFVQGRRLRVGTELNWREGPLSVQSEYIHVSEQRRGVGIELQDLPDLISRGWYLTGTWLLTGEKKSDTVKPRKDFLRGGIGALELAARYDTIQFGSAGHSGVSSRSARAPNILENSDRVITLGMNWYLNRFWKIQINGVRENLEDRANAPVAGHAGYWTTVVRLQFHM
jgi:phosphate-selective porin OprO and OprP